MTKPTEVTTKPVRLSYPHLFEPRPKDPKKPEGDKVYSVQLLLPPDFDLSPFKAAMKAAIAEKFGGKQPNPNKMSPHGNPLRKMESAQSDEGAFPQGMVAGGHFIRTANKYAPGVVDKMAQPIKDAKLVYPGCWANVHLKAFAWDYQGAWGVSFSLEAVQFVRDDDRLDGRKAATDIFAPIEGAEPPAGATAGGGGSDQGDLFDI